MQESMVTGRMSSKKKAAGNAILKKSGMNASQAINALYSRIIEDKSAEVLTGSVEKDPLKWKVAAAFVDSLVEPKATRFDSMSDADIRMERLRSKGLM